MDEGPIDIPEGEDGQEEEFEVLAGYLTALGHPRRLELLSQLRVARTIGEIRLKPWRREAEGNPDRAISRNAVERHLLALKAIGVVDRRAGRRDGRSVEEYRLQHARVFQVVEELRALTQLRARDPVSLDVTDRDPLPVGHEPVQGPHLVLLSGPQEGRVHRLDPQGTWTIGRASPCQILLDYDPYVSSAHTVVAAHGDAGFEILDLRTNRNGTLLNWRPLPRGGAAPLRSGDVLRVGRSLILFREDRPENVGGP